jgi:acetyltransferase
MLRGSGHGMRALASVARWRPRRPPSRRPGAFGDLRGLLRQGALPEYESGAILERCGIGVARRARARTVDEAAQAAAAIGFPVVLKRDGPAHKSREGGVVLGLSDEASVRLAAERLGLPVLVAAQVAPGLEVFCGMSRDPEIGPVLVVGLGGSAAEILPGKSLCAAPIDLEMASEMITGAQALSGVLPPDALEPLARVLVAVGDLAVEHPEIAAVDINPLVIGQRDVVAVDALVVVEAERGR